VKLDKLAKQLRRDLTANPKKAAILGLMLLVAAYFWGPLVWKWTGGGASKKGTKAAQTALILVDDPAEPTAQAKAAKGKTFRWEAVRQLIQGDTRMTTAAFDAAWNNPFVAAETEQHQPSLLADVPSPEAAAEKAPIEIDPAKAGLTLASVAIGPRRRTATISGDTYREGDLVPVAAAGTKGKDMDFKLVRIERQGVELARNGKSWWLTFDEAQLAHGDEILRASGSKHD
jgi:hypothetical protein